MLHALRQHDAGAAQVRGQDDVAVGALLMDTHARALEAGSASARVRERESTAPEPAFPARDEVRRRALAAGLVELHLIATPLQSDTPGGGHGVGAIVDDAGVEDPAIGLSRGVGVRDYEADAIGAFEHGPRSICANRHRTPSTEHGEE